MCFHVVGDIDGEVDNWEHAKGYISLLSHACLLKDNSELEDNYSRVSCCLGLVSVLECLQNFPNMASSYTLFHSELEDNYTTDSYKNPPKVQGIKFQYEFCFLPIHQGGNHSAYTH